MTLFDSPNDDGMITAINGDAETHRRLVDLGLLNARYRIKARRKSAVCVYFENGVHGFCAVVEAGIAKRLEVER